MVTGPTNETLTRERNRFLLWMLGLFVAPRAVSLILVLFLASHGAAELSRTQQAAELIAKLVALGLYGWRVWILCRVLRFRWWWTAASCVLSILVGYRWLLGIIPLVGIFFSFKKARVRALGFERTSGKPGSPL